MGSGKELIQTASKIGAENRGSEIASMSRKSCEKRIDGKGPAPVVPDGAMPGIADNAQDSVKPSEKNGQRKRAHAKWLKVIGTGLLLLAFGAQMYQTKVAATEADRMAAAEMDGRSQIKALSYENLYFAEKIATGLEDTESLRGAALNKMIGRFGMIATSDAASDVKQRRMNEVRKEANLVKDLDTFNSFMQFLNQQIGQAHPDEVRGLVQAGQIANEWWKAYIATYIVGSLFLLLGQCIE